jgi:hypothetical protein
MPTKRTATNPQRRICLLPAPSSKQMICGFSSVFARGSRQITLAVLSKHQGGLIATAPRRSE